MTKRDYELIADAIGMLEVTRVNDEHVVALGDVCMSIAKALADDNERFDEHRFYARIMETRKAAYDAVGSKLGPASA